MSQENIDRRSLRVGERVLEFRLSRNARGVFLRIVESNDRTGGFNQVIIPIEALTESLDLIGGMLESLEPPGA